MNLVVAFALSVFVSYPVSAKFYRAWELADGGCSVAAYIKRNYSHEDCRKLLLENTHILVKRYGGWPKYFWRTCKQPTPGLGYELDNGTFVNNIEFTDFACQFSITLHLQYDYTVWDRCKKYIEGDQGRGCKWYMEACVERRAPYITERMMPCLYLGDGPACDELMVEECSTNEYWCQLFWNYTPPHVRTALALTTKRCATADGTPAAYCTALQQHVAEQDDWLEKQCLTKTFLCDGDDIWPTPCRIYRAACDRKLKANCSDLDTEMMFCETKENYSKAGPAEISAAYDKYCGAYELITLLSKTNRKLNEAPRGEIRCAWAFVSIKSELVSVGKYACLHNGTLCNALTSLAGEDTILWGMCDSKELFVHPICVRIRELCYMKPSTYGCEEIIFEAESMQLKYGLATNKDTVQSFARACKDIARCTKFVDEHFESISKGTKIEVLNMLCKEYQLQCQNVLELMRDSTMSLCERGIWIHRELLFCEVLLADCMRNNWRCDELRKSRDFVIDYQKFPDSSISKQIEVLERRCADRTECAQVGEFLRLLENSTVSDLNMIFPPACENSEELCMQIAFTTVNDFPLSTVVDVSKQQCTDQRNGPLCLQFGMTCLADFRIEILGQCKSVVEKLCPSAYFRDHYCWKLMLEHLNDTQIIAEAFVRDDHFVNFLRGRCAVLFGEARDWRVTKFCFEIYPELAIRNGVLSRIYDEICTSLEDLLTSELCLKFSTAYKLDVCKKNKEECTRILDITRRLRFDVSKCGHSASYSSCLRLMEEYCTTEGLLLKFPVDCGKLVTSISKNHLVPLIAAACVGENGENVTENQLCQLYEKRLFQDALVSPTYMQACLTELVPGCSWLAELCEQYFPDGSNGCGDVKSRYNLRLAMDSLNGTDVQDTLNNLKKLCGIKSPAAICVEFLSAEESTYVVKTKAVQELCSERVSLSEKRCHRIVKHLFDNVTKIAEDLGGSCGRDYTITNLCKAYVDQCKVHTHIKACNRLLEYVKDEEEVETLRRNPKLSLEMIEGYCLKDAQDQQDSHVCSIAKATLTSDQALFTADLGALCELDQTLCRNLFQEASTMSDNLLENLYDTYCLSANNTIICEMIDNQCKEFHSDQCIKIENAACRRRDEFDTCVDRLSKSCAIKEGKEYSTISDRCRDLIGLATDSKAKIERLGAVCERDYHTCESVAQASLLVSRGEIVFEIWCSKTLDLPGCQAFFERCEKLSNTRDCKRITAQFLNKLDPEVCSKEDEVEACTDALEKNCDIEFPTNGQLDNCNQLYDKMTLNAAKNLHSRCHAVQGERACERLLNKIRQLNGIKETFATWCEKGRTLHSVECKRIHAFCQRVEEESCTRVLHAYTANIRIFSLAGMIFGIIVVLLGAGFWFLLIRRQWQVEKMKDDLRAQDTPSARLKLAELDKSCLSSASTITSPSTSMSTVNSVLSTTASASLRSLQPQPSLEMQGRNSAEKRPKSQASNPPCEIVTV